MKLNWTIIRKHISHFIYYYAALFTVTTLRLVLISHHNPVYFKTSDFIVPAIFGLAMILFWGREPIFNWFKWEWKKGLLIFSAPFSLRPITIAPELCSQ